MTTEEIYNIQLDAVNFFRNNIPNDNVVAYMFLLSIKKDDGFGEHFISSQGESAKSAVTIYELMKDVQRFNDTIWTAVTNFIISDLNDHDKKSLSNFIMGKSKTVDFQYRSKINYSEMENTYED